MDNNQMAADRLVEQANFFHREKEYEQAIAAYREAIALMPHDPTYLAYHFMIGDMLAEMQRYAEAADAFRETVQAVAHYDEAWLKLGQCLLKLEQDAAAVDAFDRCLEILLARSEGDRVEAWYEFETNDRISQAWYDGALAHARLGHPAEARRYLAAALQLQPSRKRHARQEPLLKDYVS